MICPENYCNGGQCVCGRNSVAPICDCPVGKKGPQCEENDLETVSSGTDSSIKQDI